MKTIINEGPKLFYCGCNACGTKFTYEIDDVGRMRDVDGNEEYYVVICPKCNATNKHSIINALELCPEELENEITVKEKKQ